MRSRGRVPWYHQPPAYSPVSAKVIAGAFQGHRTSSRKVENRLCSWLSGRVALLLDSGTSALQLAMRCALVLRPGAPIVLPAYGCYDLATAAVGSGARVDFYDLDLKALQPELRSLVSALEQGPSAVVVAHLYGLPVELSSLTGMVHESGAMLIEDAAQGAGATVDDVPVGSFGDLSVLSFGRGKGMSAGGGGALVVRNAALEPLARSIERIGAPRGGLKALATLVMQALLGRPETYGFVAGVRWLGFGETVYRTPRRVSAMNAASRGAVCRLLEAADGMEIERRRQHAAEYAARLPDFLGVFTSVPRAAPGFLRFPVLAQRSLSAAERNAARRLGVMRGYPEPLNDLPAIQAWRCNPARSYPNAGRLAAALLTLPTHSLVSVQDVQRTIAWLERTFCARTEPAISHRIGEPPSERR